MGKLFSFERQIPVFGWIVIYLVLTNKEQALNCARCEGYKFIGEV